MTTKAAKPLSSPSSKASKIPKKDQDSNLPTSMFVTTTETVSFWRNKNLWQPEKHQLWNEIKIYRNCHGIVFYRFQVSIDEHQWNSFFSYNKVQLSSTRQLFVVWRNDGFPLDYRLNFVSSLVNNSCRSNEIISMGARRRSWSRESSQIRFEPGTISPHISDACRCYDHTVGDTWPASSLGSSSRWSHRQTRLG